MKNHDILTICMKNHYTNNFVVINQINKHKAKIIITACILKLL